MRGLEQGYILATAETSIFVSLVFTLGPVFRRIISDPEKVAFVKFTHHHSEVVAIHRAQVCGARAEGGEVGGVAMEAPEVLARASTPTSRWPMGSSARVVY